jgi:hypothetical protein
MVFPFSIFDSVADSFDRNESHGHEGKSGLESQADKYILVEVLGIDARRLSAVQPYAWKKAVQDKSGKQWLT